MSNNKPLRTTSLVTTISVGLTFVAVVGFYIHKNEKYCTEEMGILSCLTADTSEETSSKRILEDGSEYEGEWLNDKPHGYGVMRYADGNQYFGNFMDGKRSGSGKMLWENGSRYEGTWLLDQPEGKGTFWYPNGAVYTGDFKAGIKHGVGNYVYADGTEYSGTWNTGVPRGEGTMLFPDGAVYQGQFSNGQPHGSGSYTFTNGDKYNGQWNNGQMSGKGTMHYVDGASYTGQFHNGFREGQGSLKTASGITYTGPFINNLQHGTGICVIDGKSTACTYKNGERVRQPVKQNVAIQKTKLNATPKTKAKISKPTPTKPAMVVTTKSSKPTLSKSSAKQATEPKASVSKKPKVKPASTITVAKPDIGLETIELAKAIIPVSTAALASNNKETAKAALPEISLHDKSEAFKNTLEKELSHFDQKYSIADLPNKSPEILFAHNFEELDLMAIPEHAWWEKKYSLFRDTLRIISIHGPVQIVMDISNYKGPGTYKLEDGHAAVVVNKKVNYQSMEGKPGTITIKEDDEEWITGEFQFTSFETESDSAKESRTIRSGVFRLANKPARAFIRCTGADLMPKLINKFLPQKVCQST